MKSAQLALLLALGISSSVAAADIGELAGLCEDCHGPGGVSTDADVPTIAGQTASFLNKSLNSFQIWGRPCIKSKYRHGDTSRPRTDMCKIAEGLTNEDMLNLAEHFSALPFGAAAQSFDAGLVDTGKALHEQLCEECHVSGGSVAGRGPRLAGQWTVYLRSTLRFVPTGEHLVPPAMERKVSELPKEQLDALMNFYASQQ